jgi:AmiR/NasT family two-component response regulator
MRTALPNFRGQRAFILHWKDNSRVTLVRQLETLGLKVDVLWPADKVSAEGYDVIFFDADQGYDGLFDWPPGEPPIPLIAMMRSEAPGRIEWTLSRAPSAYLVKPIGSTGVFSALAIAFHTFETRRELKDAVAELTRRVKARPFVFKAILGVMSHFGIGEDDAYQLLRAESMNLRVSIEDLCELIASNEDTELNRLAVRNKGSLRHVNRG